MTSLLENINTSLAKIAECLACDPKRAERLLGDVKQWVGELAEAGTTLRAAGEPNAEEAAALYHASMTETKGGFTEAIHHFARALLSRYGRPAGDAQPVEHGPWIKSTLKEYEGQRYCGKCCVMFEYRDRRPCVSAPVAAHKPDGGDVVDKSSNLQGLSVDKLSDLQVRGDGGDAKDGVRYRYARDNIKEGHSLPGGFWLSDTGKGWDKTIDAAISAQQRQEGA